MKRKTKLLKHFLTLLHIGAIATPLIVLGFHALNDSLPKFFASQSVQHHGGESDVFSDDLDYANEQLKTRSLDDNLFLTMDSMNYMNYGVTDSIDVVYDYQTNVVSSADDLIVGNIYKFTLDTTAYSTTTKLIDITYLRIRSLGVYADFYGTSIDFYWNSGPYLRVYGNNNSYYRIFAYPSTFVCYVVYDGFLHSSLSYLNFEICPQQYIPYHVVTPSTNVTSLDDWKTYYNNKNYAQIIDTGVSTHLPINVDFVSLFTQSDIINHDGNIATLLFINFYCNWLINVSMIVFMPEIVMVFFDLVRSIIYKVTDFKEECEV